MASKSIPTILILFTTLIPLSNGSNKQYKICSSTASCGHIKDIRYPFWIDNSVPGYCGLPDFRVECYNPSDNPYMWIKSFGENCRLQSISRSNCTIVVKREKSNTCLALQTSAQTAVIFSGDNPFSLGATVTNLTLYLGCRNSIVKRVDKRSVILCSNSNVGTSAYYLVEEAEVGNNPSKCQSNVTVPVSRKALEEFNRNTTGWTLERVLEAAFEVHYTIPTFEKCSACENSSGVCASSAELLSNDFVCYHNKDVGTDQGVILGSAIGGICLLTLVMLAFCLRKRNIVKFSVLWKGKPTANDKSIEACLRMHGSLAPRRYSYKDIRKMTNSFKEKLGEGGYAVVYKGRLSNGQLVAVKLLKQSKANNGEDLINEVASMGRTNHVNVLKLLGFCFDTNKRALIYEFMPNGSLDKFTHGNTSHHPSLSQNTIFDIVVGIAKGLEYLHQGCNTRILHFDIKPHNILLDKDFHPKISDFGLARLCPRKDSTISMYEARGTIGYIAPEVFCWNFGGVSHKSDVYSYGMMVLDMVCGRGDDRTCVGGAGNVSSAESFSEWVYQRVQLKDEIERNGVLNDEERELQRKMILVSLWCIQTYPSNRPAINKVVEMLEGSVELIQMPPKPFLGSPPRLIFDSSILPIESRNDFTH